MRWINSSGSIPSHHPREYLDRDRGRRDCLRPGSGRLRAFAKISSATMRALVITVVALASAFLSWQALHVWFGIDMAKLAFPIIATLWFWIAVTSFVGEEAHAAHLTPGRRTMLNAVVWIGLTLVVVLTITWIPPFWFPIAQTLLVTGGFGYLLRGIRQPVKSLYAWAILAVLTATVVGASAALGLWTSAPPTGPWTVGAPNASWSIFFAVWCGTNFGVLAMLQCWPFSRIRQPFGTAVAMVSVIAWSAAIAALLGVVFDNLFAEHALAQLEARSMPGTSSSGRCRSHSSGASVPRRTAGSVNGRRASGKTLTERASAEGVSDVEHCVGGQSQAWFQDLAGRPGGRASVVRRRGGRGHRHRHLWSRAPADLRRGR